MEAIFLSKDISVGIDLHSASTSATLMTRVNMGQILAIL